MKNPKNVLIAIILIIVAVIVFVIFKPKVIESFKHVDATENNSAFSVYEIY